MFTLMLPFEYVKDSEVKQCADMSGKKLQFFKGRVHCEIFLSEHFIKYSFRGIS